MVDLEQVRERLKQLKEEAAKAPKSVSRRLRSSFESAITDIETLIREIEELRAFCKHTALMQVFDEKGALTDAVVCVNCHQRFSKDNPMPDPEDFEL